VDADEAELRGAIDVVVVDQRDDERRGDARGDLDALRRDQDAHQPSPGNVIAASTPFACWPASSVTRTDFCGTAPCGYANSTMYCSGAERSPTEYVPSAAVIAVAATTFGKSLTL